MSQRPHAILRDTAVAAHASSARPAWLFAGDGSRLLFANAAGAALLGLPDQRSATDFALTADLAARIARSAATLRADGQPRLERLRGLGTTFGQPMTCTCARVAYAGGAAVLVAATEAIGPVIALRDRARYLIEGCEDAAAAFGADGELLYANAKSSAVIGEAAGLSDLGIGAETLAVGSGADKLVLAFLPANSAPVRTTASATAVAPEPEPDLLDLSPIAAAIVAMTKKQPQRNGHDTPSQQQDRTFVWETDAENRFTIGSEDFLALAGARTGNLLGRFWGEISAKLTLDPDGRIARALAARGSLADTTVDWPVSGSRIPVTLSAEPAFDCHGAFRGYRGRGVWRDHRDPPARPIPPVKRTTAPPPQIENVVPFPVPPAEAKPGHAAQAERNPLRDPGSRLASRLKGADELARGLIDLTLPADAAAYILPPLAAAAQPQLQIRIDAAPAALTDTSTDEDPFAVHRPVLDALAFPLLAYQGANLLYANPAFLAFAGHASLDGFAEAGGLDAIVVEFDAERDDGADGKRLSVRTTDGGATAQGLVSTAAIDGDPVTILTLQPQSAASPAPAAAAADGTELELLREIAADGVVVIDRDGTILRASRSAETLFGAEAGGLDRRAFADLFAPDSERIAAARLARLIGGSAMTDADGEDIIGRKRHGGLVSLQMILGRADSAGTRFQALFRDMTRSKDTERDMTEARRQAEKASAAKSDFLARISHEMRTPLNAIIGFSEVMMEERFGPIGNERYRDYLKDINASGTHAVSLLNDLLDLSKIEAGKMELSFERVDLNDVTQRSVAMMQAQASQARVIVRTALSMNIPAIVADTRSVRQIVLNLLSNSIKFTRAGGQVIVSTAANDRSEVILRVRDTGIGMSEQDLETALQPFRQIATTPRVEKGGTGLGLPLTKALVEANRARFTIKSAVDAGTMVEIVFPANRVLSD